MSDADRCVCCGDIIPEGRQVCPNCESGAKPRCIKSSFYGGGNVRTVFRAKSAYGKWCMAVFTEMVIHGTSKTISVE